MKQEKEIKKLLNSTGKKIEATLGMHIKNGQALRGIKTALKWVLDMDLPNEVDTRSSLDHLRRST